MYYVISWASIVILAAYGYKFVQNEKRKAYDKGFDDGWDAREDCGFELKVDVLDFMNEARG